MHLTAGEETATRLVCPGSLAGQGDNVAPRADMLRRAN